MMYKNIRQLHEQVEISQFNNKFLRKNNIVFFNMQYLDLVCNKHPVVSFSLTNTIRSCQINPIYKKKIPK